MDYKWNSRTVLYCFLYNIFGGFGAIIAYFEGDILISNIRSTGACCVFTELHVCKTLLSSQRGYRFLQCDVKRRHDDIFNKNLTITSYTHKSVKSVHLRWHSCNANESIMYTQVYAYKNRLQYILFIYILYVYDIPITRYMVYNNAGLLCQCSVAVVLYVFYVLCISLKTRIFLHQTNTT